MKKREDINRDIKMLNGFNNGRDTTDGVGGKDPFDDEFDTEFEKMKSKYRKLAESEKTQTFYIVQYPDSKEVIAMFKEKQWAEDWKYTNCRTAIIEPFKMVIR